MNKNKELLLKGKVGETLEEAVKRLVDTYEEFHIDEDDDDDNDEDNYFCWCNEAIGNAIKFNNKVPPEEILKAESRLEIQLPEKLRHFYLNIGNGGEQEGHEGFDFEKVEYISGLVEGIVTSAFGESKLTDKEYEYYTTLTLDQVKFFNNNYKVFGYFNFGTEFFAYLFFNKQGKMGVINVPTDGGISYDMIGEEVLICNYDDLDEMISKLVNVIIRAGINIEGYKLNGKSAREIHINGLMDKN